MSKYFYDYMTENQDYYSFINESQFYNPQLEEVDKLFSELRDKYALFEFSSAKINSDPIVRKISEIIRDIFGFNSFQLTIDHSKTPNAYTAPISSKIDKWNYKKKIKKSSKGIKFTPDADVNTMAVITAGLLLNNKFTSREITAILLHEIGHNFSDSINETLGVFSCFKKILLIPSMYNPLNWTNLLNSARGGATTFNNYMRKNCPDLVTAFNCLKVFKNNIDFVVFNVLDALRVFPGVALYTTVIAFANLIKKIGYDPVNFIMNIICNFFGKEDEYMSDSFPALYGYGPDLSSALLKIDRHNNTAVAEMFKSTESGAMWYAFFVESVDFITALISDNHPTTAKRLLNILNTLEQELTKDYIDPKMKKATQQEIKEIKKLIDNEMQNHSFDGNYWRVAFNRYQLSTANKIGPKEEAVSKMLDKIQGFKNE